MALDPETVRRVASLARLRLDPSEEARMLGELNGILGWIEQLRAVDTEGVEPLSGAGAEAAPLREDAVTDGAMAEAVLAGAPDRAGPYFAVPKVVE